MVGLDERAMKARPPESGKRYRRAEMEEEPQLELVESDEDDK